MWQKQTFEVNILFTQWLQLIVGKVEVIKFLAGQWAYQLSEESEIKWFKVAFASGHCYIKVEARVLESEGESFNSHQSHCPLISQSISNIKTYGLRTFLTPCNYV